MAKRQHDPVISRPLPGTRVPWLVILCLIVAIVLVHQCLLQAPNELWGGPPPRNEYLRQMHVPKPKPKPAPAVVPATSGQSPTPTASATVQTTVPVLTPSAERATPRQGQ